MVYTKGTYVKEKLNNMAKWIEQEVGSENLPRDLVTGIAGRSELEVTVLCGALQSNKTVLIHRDWFGLHKVVADVPEIPSELKEVLMLVQQREDMHDKFWRYLELFEQVVSQ